MAGVLKCWFRFVEDELNLTMYDMDFVPDSSRQINKALPPHPKTNNSKVTTVAFDISDPNCFELILKRLSERFVSV